MHHTKEKGDLGVLKAQVDLAEQGYVILAPLSEHQPFDLVAYKNGDFKRIQVKYRALDKFGSLVIKFSTCWTDRRGTHTKSINKSDVDLFCIYCPETDECYYLDPKQYKRSIVLRVNPPKNNQKADVHLAADYRRVP